MTKEELLTEAIKRYPPGTIVKPLVTNFETGELEDMDWDVVKGGHYWASGSDCPSCHCVNKGPTALFLKNKWAEILPSTYEIY